jgi:hypothetical protein
MNNLNLKTQDEKFIINPTDYLFGIIDDPEAAETVLTALVSAGFNPDRVRVFHGEQGVRQIDATGAEHGRLARLIRWRQNTTPARPHAERYEQAVRDGHCVIAVHASDQESRTQARQIMKQHGGHFINFYGRWVIYSLDS